MLSSPGLYVHLPWCIKKCPYCDFNSHAVRDTPPYLDYTEAVCADLEYQIDRFQPGAFGSVFFGGGTPSLFQPEHIERILDLAAKLAGISADAEITLEANPGAIEHGRFDGYKTAGINRISLGVQSFNSEQLRALGRIHQVDEIYAATDSIRQSGINELNIDLMYGLPEQSVKEAKVDVARAIELNPTHISHYQLTIEPNTLFAVKTPSLPDDDTCFSMQNECQQALSEAGFLQYEVSAYAKTGYEGNHNLNYWTYGDYLGVGAGAHGKVTLGNTNNSSLSSDPTPGAGTTIRTQKPKHPNQYLQAPKELTSNPSTAADYVFEFMLNRLRLRRPLTPAELAPLLALDEAGCEAKLTLAQHRKLLTQEPDGKWSKTALGERFLNNLQEIFLP